MKLIMLIPNILSAILFSWNIGLFQKKCPKCGHSLEKHIKMTDGSFTD
jgi:hypothetical protein